MNGSIRLYTLHIRRWVSFRLAEMIFPTIRYNRRFLLWEMTRGASWTASQIWSQGLNGCSEMFSGRNALQL